MDLDALTTTAPPQRQLLVCYFLRGLFCQVKVFLFVLVLLFAILCLAAYEPCLTMGMQKSVENDACSPYEGDCGTSSPEIAIAGTSLGYTAGNPTTHAGIESVCGNSHSFCFPSTLPGFSSRENRLQDADLEVARSPLARPLSLVSTKKSRQENNQSWSSDSGMFGLSNGQTVSCFLSFREAVDELLPLQTQKITSLRLNEEMKKFSSLDLSPSPHVEISPPVLEWGQKHLYFFSVAFLTVTNTCNESILHVYEPFSTNLQFYPCNFSEFSLGPGERASICFVFLPRWLGLSSAHLILQTSAGGFLVQVKGYAVESPYKISPLLGLGVPSCGQLRKNLSLFNPFDETLYVKEISAWILVSQGNNSHYTEATCRSENIQEPEVISLLSVNDWLVVKSGQVGFPLMALRPLEIWEISPHSSEILLEIDIAFESEEKISGAISMQLLRSSQEKLDKLIVPFKVDPNGKVPNDDITVPASTSLEALLTCNMNSTDVVAISVRNRAPQVLKVFEISEVAAMKIFQIKYIKDLLLFPDSVTKVAILNCTQLRVKLFVSPLEMLHLNKNCKLVVLTNDSSIPQTEILCDEVVRTCLRHQEDSAIGYVHQSENAANGNKRTGSLDDSMPMLSNLKALETAEADEFVLANWKSQGIASGMSVLHDHEVLFPMVQVGSHGCKWITVMNPSQKPVVMQLILNSGLIIDECTGMDNFLEAHSSSSLIQAEFNASIRCGFFLAEGAQTEVYVHPLGKASFGPIFFHPSDRCVWKSSALIRNNLSGVEWVSLRGHGGLLSLLVLEGSESVQTVEFNLNTAVPPDISSLGILFHMKEISYACSQQLSKELYAKNTGDLPLVVTRIEVSGTEHGLGGFLVNSLKGFSLEPGESKKLLISFHADFSASMVQRDLKLAFDGGIFVIPMKASLPLYMLNFCRKSILWMRVKKFCLAAFVPAFFTFLTFYFIVFQVIALGSRFFSYRNAKGTLSSVRSPRKSSGSQRNKKNGKHLLSNEMDSLLRLPGEVKSLKQASTGRYPDSCDGEADQGTISQKVRLTLGQYKQVDTTLCNEKDKVKALLSSEDAAESSSMVEASQSCNLTVRTGKEKGRRRRKRKGVNANLVGLFEVSSSQSGNSTPSSPLSPATSVNPNPKLLAPPDVDPIQARNPFGQVADRRHWKFQISEPASGKVGMQASDSLSYNCFSAAQEQPSVARKNSSKPVLLPSASFPAAGRTASGLLDSSSVASASTIAPHVRAPGPNQKTGHLEGKGGDKYTYDIWGDHFSGLNIVGSRKNVTTLKTIATENNSNSFFVRGPQALVTKTQSKYVSCFQQEG